LPPPFSFRLADFIFADASRCRFIISHFAIFADYFRFTPFTLLLPVFDFSLSLPDYCHYAAAIFSRSPFAFIAAFAAEQRQRYA